jgi:hypothetical protein
MRKIINHPEFASPTPGWTAALRHADPRFLWQTVILDANAAYASLWSNRERGVVARAIADTYERSRMKTQPASDRQSRPEEISCTAVLRSR